MLACLTILVPWATIKGSQPEGALHAGQGEEEVDEGEEPEGDEEGEEEEDEDEEEEDEGEVGRLPS